MERNICLMKLSLFRIKSPIKSSSPFLDFDPMNSIFSIKLLFLSAVVQMSYVFAGLALTKQFGETLAPRAPEAIAAARTASGAAADTAAVQAGAVSAGSKSNARLIDLVQKSVVRAQAGKTFPGRNVPLSLEEKAAAQAMIDKFNRLPLEEKMRVFRDQATSFSIAGGVVGGVGGVVGGGVVGGIIGNSVGKKNAEKKHEVDDLQKQSAVAPSPIQAAA